MGGNEHGGAHARPGWIPLRPDPAFVFLHLPEKEARDTAILMCPPFGWEEARSYRPWRAWARALAAEGFPTLRLTFPGSGDSGGLPTDPERLEAWTASVSESAAWLRGQTQCARVVAIGVGLGGLLACRAVAGHAPIDDLVLWAVPATGKRMVRELKTYAAIAASQEKIELPQPQGDEMQLTGYLMSAETVTALRDLDLTKLDVPDAADRRVLMLERDSLGVDEGLRRHFVDAGADVSTQAAGDYGAMMSTPQLAVLPPELVPAIREWIDARGRTTVPAAADGGPQDTIELDVGGTAVRESVISFRIGVGSGFGIITEPTGGEREPVWAVMLNAGALSHVGPNRMWVEAARRWAARGITCVRVDLEAIGESDGDERQHDNNSGLYDDKLARQTSSLLDQLDARGGPGRYMLTGTCSGAYWALHAAVGDTRAVGALLVNLAAFKWSEELGEERRTQGYRRAMRAAARRRLRERDVDWKHLRTAAKEVRGGTFAPNRAKAESGQLDTASEALSALRDQGTETLLLLSETEPVRQLLERRLNRSRYPNLSIEPIPSSDHLFRDVALQQIVHASLDQASARVLQRTRAITRAPD